MIEKNQREPARDPQDLERLLIEIRRISSAC